MHRQILECDDIVLRALLRSTNIDRENNRILAAEFLLRSPKDGTKEEALSVTYDCSHEECMAGFDTCYGVATLHVGRIRDLGLGVTPDEGPDGSTHASIEGLPHKEDNPVEAERFASQLARQARPVLKE